MAWNNKNEDLGGRLEKGFTLTGDTGDVPGVYWEPQGGSDRLVLLGHGGGTNKKTEYILYVSEKLASKGIATMAIDGPGHGERTDEDFGTDREAFMRKWNSGGGNAGMLKDWRLALDFIEDEFGARPTGWWGLSMGTMMGLPVCVTDDRIKVALLGLMGTWGPNGKELRELAPKLTCPIRFLVQWDDEVVPRDRCIELFGLIGSARKTMHVNPGKHAAVPVVEFKGSVDYLDRYLK